MKELQRILSESGCSLVVRDTEGNVSLHWKKGVRDLIWLLDNDPGRLKGSEIADKVIGKAAAALAVVGGVRRLYAAVLSERAVPCLDAYGIGYTFGELVPKIVIPEGDDRCPLEEIVLDAATPSEAEALLREHFRKMQERSQNTK
jgi:hypothetical protein